MVLSQERAKQMSSPRLISTMMIIPHDSGTTTLTFADLFCGCGGLALGFQLAGFQSVFAADVDKAACQTYEANFHHPVICGDIASIKQLPLKPDIMIGGPPCQGFSLLGRMTPSDTCKVNHATLNTLWHHYVRLVEVARPKAFVIENVPQFLRSKEFPILAGAVEELGYNITTGVLKAEEFEVPQLRRRGFILGALDFMPALPAPLKSRRTVRDAIGDLPRKPTDKDLHYGRNPTQESLVRYRCIPEGGNRFDLMKSRPDLCPRCWMEKKTGSTDVFGRLRWDSQSLTIRTEFFKPEKGCYLHPSEHRPITHREAARLQTFPDNFVWVGTKTQIARMIGNAVPPKLAYHIARSLRKRLSTS